jgi:hypothetical protein
MPQYITKGNNSYNGNCCTTSSDSCQSSVTFFSTLSQKMLEMVDTLQKQFQECKENAKPTEVKGFFLASIDAPTSLIGVKYEYLEYINRYGPPKDGIFDEILLAKLRSELGIVTFD